MAPITQASQLRHSVFRGHCFLLVRMIWLGRLLHTHTLRLLRGNTTRAQLRQRGSLVSASAGQRRTPLLGFASIGTAVGTLKRCQVHGSVQILCSLGITPSLVAITRFAAAVHS